LENDHETIKHLILGISLTFTGFAIAGEFDNNCTNGLSKHAFHKTNCDINEIYNSKTYCFSSEGARDSFLFDPQEMINKAEKFYAENAKNPISLKADKTDAEREKISQADALAQINSKTCDLSNKDAGYLIFNGLDLSHCNMQNVSFFGAELMGAKLTGANLQGAYLNLAH
jgi:uncharacterized protein YjbI with pentapeptide repeats